MALWAGIVLISRVVISPVVAIRDWVEGLTLIQHAALTMGITIAVVIALVLVELISQ